MESSNRCGITCCDVADCTSTTGDPPVTVSVSVRSPTRISPLICAVKFAGRSIPSRLTVANPGSVNDTE